MGISDEFSYEKLGEAIKLFRQQKELKQSYVAKKAGISQPHYCKVEQGARHLPLDKFLAVCDMLEVSPLLLFFLAGYRKTYGLGKIFGNKIPKTVLIKMNNEAGQLLRLSKIGGG